MTMHTALPRRTVLRGVGATLALPFLDAMVPAFARTAHAAAAPNRMVFVYVPNGIVMPQWTPETAGPIAPLPVTLPRVLEPMIPYRNDISVLSGLTHNGGRALGDGPGDHARAGASYLTGVHPKKTYGADIHAGVSADQIAARHLGGETRFGSLELGCEPGLLRRQLRQRLQLRLQQQHLVAHARVADAPRSQPAGGVRAPVRRRGHQPRSRRPRPAAALRPQRARRRAR